MKKEFEFIKGQRFISQTEQELGLGRVEETNHRMVKLIFDAANESRIYAKDNAPISRILFEVGDKIPARAGWNLKIETIQQLNGLAIYQGIDDNGDDVLLPETEVADSIKLDRPAERMFSGHLDSNKWFNLRQLAITKRNELQQNPLYGLLGCRTSLLKHQLYITQSVAKRFAPRVLLADEVGLGKTIEAGLIIHQQLLKNRSKRILVIVPESLTHQWMVEMLRRFNLHFSVYNEELCHGIEESSRYETPFESSQLAIIPLQYLLKNHTRAQQVLQTQWDLLVVDEAHHLQWSKNEVSEEYSLIEGLANKIKGVLLLTATPEQLGKESHFARLRLLDASRFNSFSNFLEQEQNYQSIVNAIDVLRSEKNMTKTGAKNTAKMFSLEKDLELIQGLFEDNYENDEKLAIKQQLTEQLLDQHGTGRLLFRNTRSAVKGFPKRKVHKDSLENPYDDATEQELQLQLTPELIKNFDNWTKIDPRIPWLVEKITNYDSKKILLIAASKKTVLDIAESLRVKQGIHAAVFHEDLSLIERDKAAAWFADQEKGTQILLCSEIGSEGRNFQFSHHVIFFDLPFNPDLLEQRIGRLDRIGQENTIHIHVPYLKGTASEKLFKWFHQGLNVFAKTCPAAYSIFNQQKSQLIEYIGKEVSEEDFASFIETTQELTQEANQKFQKGRDRLLEYNSCRPFVADKIMQDAEMQDDTSCQRFMHRMFDRYGVDYEELRRNVELIKPGESQHSHFPGLIEDGMSITFDRDTALSNENLHYITWEHPMVVEAIEMIASGEKGNASLIALQNTGLPPSTVMIESLLNLHAPADASLQLSRYIPADSIRLIADEKLMDRTKALTIQFIHNNHSSVPLNVALQVIKMKVAEMKKIITAIENKAERILPELIKQAQELAEKELDGEIIRLQNLSKINDNIRCEEIEHLQTQKQLTLKALSEAKIQMNAVRVLVCL
ncbi:MAG: RNA polymerase-associated protein RapA [Alcanivoracaceae bacterium]|nr:RNA polymerase-associated protein RapA [Alcanivoracaceae bacterium]